MVTPTAGAGRWLAGVATLLFVGASALTIRWCSSMSTMGMPMPGGWTMSMAWMRMPGQSWPGAAAAFLGMWIVMMAAMMLPSLLPMLARYRQAVDAPQTRLEWLTVVAAAGYFCVWAVAGAVAYPIGAALAALEMTHEGASRTVPAASAIVVLLAGVLQWTTWKARELACCVTPGPSTTWDASAGAAWRHGLTIGRACLRCCANLMVLLLTLGVMDLTAMVLVTAAVSAERLLPDGVVVARATGSAAVLSGLGLLVGAVGGR